MTEIPHLSEDEVEGRQDDHRRVVDEPRAEVERPPVEDHRVFVGTGFFWGLIVGLILATLMIVLAAQNTDSVAIRFLGWEQSTPLIVVILGSVLVGVVLDEIAGAIYRRRRRRILNERAELQRLRDELSDR